MKLNAVLFNNTNYQRLIEELPALFNENTVLYKTIKYFCSHQGDVEPSLSNILTLTTSKYTEDNNVLNVDSLDLVELLMAVEDTWDKVFTCTDLRTSFTLPDKEASYMLRSDSPRPYSQINNLPSDCLRVGDILFYMFVLNKHITEEFNREG